MNKLYPLKFKPRFYERIWGGRTLQEKMNKKLPAGKTIGESWELSGVEGEISVVSNGFLAGNNLEELIEVYMGDLVGDRIYEKFGLQFPLLIKLIDARDDLSIQVHPDDKLALERHDSFGKTEMWYVVDRDPGAGLYMGFNKPVTRQEYLDHVEAGTLADIMLRVDVKPGDTFFIPAGAIHAIGKGILIAEIQQTSDITYRVFDWNRVDGEGKSRQLHTELALDAIEFKGGRKLQVDARAEAGRAVNLVSCPYFTTNVIESQGSVERDYYDKDTFVIFMVLEGDMKLKWDGGEDTIRKGETILVPAAIEHLGIEGKGKLLEIYID